MASLLSKERIMIVVGTYTDKQGNPKKEYKQIGERLSFQGDDGSVFAKGRIWGAGGASDVSFWEDDKKPGSVPSQPAPTKDDFEDDVPF